MIRFQNEAESAGWKKAVESFSGDGKAFAQYVLYQKLAASYRRIMVNTADSPMMKIFEEFATTSEPSQTRRALNRSIVLSGLSFSAKVQRLLRILAPGGGSTKSQAPIASRPDSSAILASNHLSASSLRLHSGTDRVTFHLWGKKVSED